MAVLMVENGINISDDTVIARSLDSLKQVLLRTPLGALRSLLVELAKVPDIVATIRLRMRLRGWKAYMS